MPVFTKLKEGVLVVTVDGDYTSGELQRVAERGVRDPGTPRPARVLLDVTGAATGGTAGSAGLVEAAAFLRALGPDLGWMAILAPEGLASGLGGAAVFRTRVEALAWLEAQGEATG